MRIKRDLGCGRFYAIGSSWPRRRGHRVTVVATKGDDGYDPDYDDPDRWRWQSSQVGFSIVH